MNALKEAQASLSYYGFKRAPEGDFEDDGTRFFMWVWDPENTGESPFYFSKAGGCGEVFFSEQIRYGSDLYNEIKKRGYHLDDLNGVPKESFTDEALGKIIAQLQEIRESDWFEAICPEFSTRGAIENGVQIKDYNADKDHQRVMDFAKRAGGDTEKMAKLAANMAKAIGDKEKMRSRWQAAVDIYGSESPVAKAFENQVNERGWYINIKPRSGDIDWSSLFESVSLDEEDLNGFYLDLADNFGGDNIHQNEDGSITIRDKATVLLADDDSGEHYIITDNNDYTEERIGFNEMIEYVNELLNDNIQESTLDKVFKPSKSLTENINDEHIYKAHADYEKDQLKKKEEEDNQENFTFDEGSVKLATVKESVESFAEEIARRIDETGIFTSHIVNRQNYSEVRVICDRGQIAVFEPENGIIKIFEPSDNDMGVTDGREFLHAYKDEEEYLPSFSKNSIRSLVDYYALKTLYEDDEHEFSYWNRAKNAAWTFEASNLSDVNKYLTVLEDAYEEAKEMSSSIKESTNWNNFFDKLTESTDNDIAALKEYFDTEDVELSDETCWGLPAYIVNGSETYAVGHSDECYEAAVQSAISVFDDDTEEGKINWLQKWNWPGVDEEGVCEACGDDPDDYEEGETIYQPSSISEYLDTMGFSQASDAFSWDFLKAYVNKHEVGEFVVDYDGIANGLASYDGKEIELPNGLYAYRFR